MKDIGRALGLITQIGISMLVPILICLGVGVFLDRLCGTSPLLMFIFIILGVAAGFRSEAGIGLFLFLRSGWENYFIFRSHFAYLAPKMAGVSVF